MKQFLRSFLTLLMLVVWASGFAADITADFTNGKPTGWEKNGSTQKNPDYGTQLHKNTSVTSPAFTESIKTITIKLTRSKGGTTFTVGYIKEGEKTTTNFKTFQKDNVTQNSLKDYIVEVPTEAQMSGVKFVFTSTASSYYVKTITFTPGVSKTATTLTFPQSAINIEEGNETTFTGQAATLKAGKTELDKTITYTKSGDDIFATFDAATGAATLKTGVYGTATVTATYAGDDTFEKAEASYTVTIKNPNVLETAYDFVNNSYGYPRKGNLTKGAIISNESPVTIVNTKNGSRTSSMFTEDDFRNYKDAILTINAKEGYFINKITITGTRINQLNLKEENGTWNDNDGVWTGSSSSISFTNLGGKTNSVIFETITIEYTVPAPLPLDEATTETDATVILRENLNKTINVTINRTLVANKWNTLCLPFDVTAEQIKNILKAEGMVREYKGQTADCMNFQTAETMTAGVPYLIKPTEEVKGLTFEGVKITADKGKTKGGIGSENLTICGILGAHKLGDFELFLNASGKFVAPAPGKETMKGFRAYFISLISTNAKINIDGETTDINNIETEATVNGKVYNLNGQYVGNSLNGLKKGIYVMNGKKVIK